VKKTVFIIMIITFFSRVIGFGREVVLSYYFGATNISDSYIVSLTIPNVIFGLIAAGITTSYIPMQTRILEESGEKQGARFTSNFTNVILIVTAILLILCLVFTSDLVKLFALGFTGETLALTIKLTKISLFGMFFTALIAIYSGFLQIKNNYVIPALMGIPLSIIVVISIIIASQGNYSVLAFGTLFAMIIQFFLMVPFLKKAKFNYSLYLDLKDKRILKTAQLALPIIIGTSVTQINLLVDTTIASSLVTGGVTALSYANRLNLLIQGLFVLSIITVLYPMISLHASKQNYVCVRKLLTESIILVTIFLLPITVGILIFSGEIIILVYDQGAFDSAAIQLTSRALFFYGVGILGFGLRQVLTRGFYVMQQTKVPVINGVIGMILNIVLNIVLSKYMGIGGLALATSISAIFTTLLLFISYHKINGSLGLKQICISFLKILIASMGMGVLAKLCFNYFSATISMNISFLLSICIGALSYFIAIIFMKVKDVDSTIKIIKSKLLKRFE
jgi:putative peptidoglycan lipid II flippase